MVLDNEVIFSDKQAITASGATASTNVLDLGAPGVTAYNAVTLRRRLGRGPIPLLLKVDQAFAGAMTTLQVDVQEGDAADFSGTNRVVASFGAIAKASLVPGYQFPYKVLPRDIKQRYLRFLYTMDDAATAGQITAAIVAAVDDGYVGHP
jgi:hypothetical protein